MPAQDPTVSTETNGGELVATAVSFLVITFISIGLRAYVRLCMQKGFHLDDWFILVAQAIFTLSCAFILRGVYYGLGHHNKALDQFDEIAALEFQALATATYVMNMAFIKLSIAVFLLRLAVQKVYRYILWISLIIVGIWSLVLFIWDLFIQCHPVQAQWDYRILADDPTSFCASADSVVSAAYALSAMTVISDWLYALLPIPMIWNVKMTTQAKVTVIAILSLGVFASIATLIRLKFLSDLTDTTDILNAGTDAMVWTLIEPGVAITASSMATIRPLLRAWRIKGFESDDSRRTGRSGGSYAVSQGTRTGKMPGFGSSEVTQTSAADVDIELGNHTTITATDSIDDAGDYPRRLKKARMSNILESDAETGTGGVRGLKIGVTTLKVSGEHARGGSPPLDGQRSSTFPGATRVTFLSGEDSPSSSVEFSGPEHNQSDGRVGLGSAGRS